MLAETAAALSGVKGAIDIVKGVSSLKTSVEMNEFKSGLLEKLVETQLALSELTERLTEAQRENRELRAQIEKGDDWAAFAQRFHLVDTGQGAKAYHPIEGNPSPESGDWACPTCWEQHRHSMLIPETGPYLGTLTCPVCEWNVRTYRRPMPQPRNDRGDWMV